MNKVNSYTVSTLTSIYSQSLSSTLDAQIITLEGFYFDNQGKLYGTHYYDELHDKNKKNKITLQLTDIVKSKLNTGRYYQLEGYINKGQNITNDSRIQIYFRATKILEHKAQEQLISKVEYDIVRERFNREYPVIQDILLDTIEKGKRPVLNVITGVQSTSQADYIQQLHDYEYYTILHHRCNLSSHKELLEFITTHDFKETDLLVILRGGGSGLEVFNEIELCKKFIELPVPFVTGIGHDENVTLLQKISDKAFSTPTSVGVFLQKVINIYKERKRVIEEKDLEILQINKQAVKDKEAFMQTIHFQKKNLNRTYVILAIMFIIILILMYKFLS